VIIERERPYLAEFALVGIATVWGLTFPMVQDAVARISTMTFLAYRFFRRRNRRGGVAR
jgi:hypothetical protein